MLMTPSDEIIGDGVGYLQLMKLQKNDWCGEVMKKRSIMELLVNDREAN